MKKELWRILWRMLLWFILYFIPITIGAIVLIDKDPSIMKMYKEVGVSVLVEQLGVYLTLSYLSIIIVFLGLRYVNLSFGLIEKQSIWHLVGMIVLITVAYIAIDLAQVSLPFWEKLFPKEMEELQNDVATNAFTILCVSILAPIAEEIGFRGILLGGLLRMRCHPWLAIFVSAIVFGAFHGHYVTMIGSTGFGIIAGWLFWRTGSLFPGIVLHIFNNTFAIVVDTIVPNIDEYMKGLPTFFVILAVALPVLLFFLRRIDKMLPKMITKK